MKLGETLFQRNHRIFEVVDSNLGADHRDWNLVPLAGETLAGENTLSGIPDGVFVLEALAVASDGICERAYVDVVLPEREIGSHYLLKGGSVAVGRGTIIANAQMIPAMAIEQFGVYEQYYARGRAQVGIDILRRGLAVAKLKWPIALDLAYILRDEKRHAEAVEAFSIVLNKDEIAGGDYYYYAERAKLYARLGNQAAANQDWERVERMAGPAMLKNVRGF
jgi:tetratricopeptide (TPR) repeat protein